MRGPPYAQYVDAGQTVQVLFSYAVSRTDTRMTGSYLYYSVNWVQSARRTTERGRARRVSFSNNNTRDSSNERDRKNKCKPFSVTFLRSIFKYSKKFVKENCQNASKRQNIVPSRRCVDVFPILLYAA